MRLADKHTYDNKNIFSSPAVGIPMSDEEASSVIDTLSEKDCLFLGMRERDIDPHPIIPSPCCALDWIQLLGLIDLSSFERVILSDGPDDAVAVVDKLSTIDDDKRPFIAYSIYHDVDGAVPTDFIFFQDGEWTPSFDLSEDMLACALSAFISSCGQALYTHHAALATGAIPKDAPTPSSCSRVISVLSCDAISIPPSMFSPMFACFDLPIFRRKMIREANEAKSSRLDALLSSLHEISILSELYDKAWHQSGVLCGFSVTREQLISGFRRSDKEIIDTLTRNGFPSYLDAALAGVPVDDLLA